MKKPAKILLVIGGSIGALAIGLALLYGLGVVITSFMRGNDDYTAKVQTLESAKKTFAVGEVAQLGPYDVQVVSIQKNYQPSEGEAATARKTLVRYERPVNSDTEHYVLVTLNVTYNEARSGYDRLGVSTGDWLDQLDELDLNNNRALVVTPGTNDQTPRERDSTAKSENGLTKTLLYRTAKDAVSLTLAYEITIFTKVSSLVGTEGMPSKTYEYTISIQ